METTAIATSTNPLNDALAIAASTKKQRDAGKRAYKAAIENDQTRHQAYYAALDAAAPDDRDRWLAGRDELVAQGELSSTVPITTQKREPTKSVLIVKGKEAIAKMRNKDADKDTSKETRPRVVFFKRVVAGAFIGLMVGAAFMAFLGLFGLIGAGVGDTLMPIILIATTLIGAGLGYSSAAKHLNARRHDEHEPTHTEPTLETA